MAPIGREHQCSRFPDRRRGGGQPPAESRGARRRRTAIGTAGESQFTIEIASEPAPGDQVIEEGGARVFVDSEAALMLNAAELHARTDGNQVAFGLTPTTASENGSPPGT